MAEWEKVAEVGEVPPGDMREIEAYGERLVLAPAAVLEAAGLASEDAIARGGRPVTLDPATLRITIAGHLVFDGAAGGPLDFDRDAARAAMEAPELVIGLDLGQGHGAGEAFGCDLTEAYVIENSEYTT